MVLLSPGHICWGCGALPSPHTLGSRALVCDALRVRGRCPGPPGQPLGPLLAPPGGDAAPGVLGELAAASLRIWARPLACTSRIFSRAAAPL